MQNTTICPVCYGRGTMQAGFYNHGLLGTDASLYDTCFSCKGQGVIKNDPIKISVDVLQMFEVTQKIEYDTAVKILTIMKSTYSDPFIFRSEDFVQKICNVFGINIHHIQ